MHSACSLSATLLIWKLHTVKRTLNWASYKDKGNPSLLSYFFQLLAITSIATVKIKEFLTERDTAAIYYSQNLQQNWFAHINTPLPFNIKCLIVKNAISFKFRPLLTLLLFTSLRYLWSFPLSTYSPHTHTIFRGQLSSSLGILK